MDRGAIISFPNRGDIHFVYASQFAIVTSNTYCRVFHFLYSAPFLFLKAGKVNEEGDEKIRSTVSVFDCHAGGPGSIPGRGGTFLYLFFILFSLIFYILLNYSNLI